MNVYLYKIQWLTRFVICFTIVGNLLFVLKLFIFVKLGNYGENKDIYL